MGNSQSGTRTPQPRNNSLTLSQLKLDIQTLNETLSDVFFTERLQCLIAIQSISLASVMVNSLLCGPNEGRLVTLVIRKGDRVEEVNINVEDFYHFKNIVNNYRAFEEGIITETPGGSQARSTMCHPTPDPDDDCDEDRICAICFKNNIQMILWCGRHGYCEECCNSWFEDKKKTECPMCRKKVTRNWKTSISRVIFKKGKMTMPLKTQLTKFINNRTMFLKIK